jgi:cellulose synthase/poly-beta-1,6-N-acetylglucosamine synthase-like glycosyltransferase
VIELLFWGLALVVLYAYVGYPLLIAVAAWLRPAPSGKHDGGFTPTVGIVVVVYNEEVLLETKLENCLDLDYPRHLLDVLVVSDGSTDGTERIAASMADRGVRLVSLPEQRGKASALNEGVSRAKGEILVLTDVRQRLAPDAVRRLVAHFADASVGAVSGELHLEGNNGHADAVEGVRAYWEYEKFVRQMESRFDSTVGVTGAFYALRSDLFVPLDPRTILDDVAIPMSVVQSGRRVLFDGAADAFDRISDDAAREYRRKVRTLAGNFQLIALRPGLLNPLRNRLLWQFVSHKLVRLLVPWCLLLLLLLSARLAITRGGVYTAVLAAQVAGYGLAAAGWSQERQGRALGLLTIPYSFVLLNVAAAQGLFAFLLRTQTAAWRGREVSDAVDGEA